MTSASSRARVEPIDVAAERRGVRQPHVRDEHRLRAAQVRVRRHRRPRRRRSAWCASASTSVAMRALNVGNAAPQVQPEIDGDLLVARSAGVQPACRRRRCARRARARRTMCTSSSAASSKQRRDWRARRARIVLEAGDDRATSAAESTPARAQRLGPRLAAGDVVFDQTPVDGERLAVVEDVRVGLAESKRPDQRVDMDQDRDLRGRSRRSRLRGSAASRRIGAGNGDWRPTTRQSPLKSLSRMAPVTRSCTFADERVDRLARRRVPEAVVDQIRVLHAEVARSAARDRAASRTSAAPRARCAARRRPAPRRLARLRAADAVLDHVDAADAVRAGDRLEARDQLDERHRHAVDLAPARRARTRSRRTPACPAPRPATCVSE